MVTCRPPENAWIRQEPWKPLALGALASIPAYLGVRALKYGQLASLTGGALTFSAVALTTGFLGESKVEVEPPVDPTPSWTDRVRANLARQGMPQEVLDLVTEYPDMDALSRAIYKAQFPGAEDNPPWRYLSWVGVCIPLNERLPLDCALPIRVEELETLDVSQLPQGLEQLTVGGRTWWVKSAWADKYRGFLANTSDQAKIERVMHGLGILNPDAVSWGLASRQIARQLHDAPFGRYDIWIGNQRFPASLRPNYRKILFSREELLRLTPERVERAIADLNQREVEVNGVRLFLEPGVVLPAGPRKLQETWWKWQMKASLPKSVNAVIDAQRGSLDEAEVRQAITTAMLDERWRNAPTKRLAVNINGNAYTGYNRPQGILGEDFVFSKDQLLRPLYALERLCEGRVIKLVVGDQIAFLPLEEVKKIMNTQEWRTSLFYEPSKQRLRYESDDPTKADLMRLQVQVEIRDATHSPT